jgi:hypothetical protein
MAVKPLAVDGQRNLIALPNKLVIAIGIVMLILPSLKPPKLQAPTVNPCDRPIKLKNAMTHKLEDWNFPDPTPAKHDADYPERLLWCAVIDMALYDARHGDCFAQKWFDEPGGTFAVCAHYLELNARLIRRTIGHGPGKQSKKHHRIT